MGAGWLVPAHPIPSHGTRRGQEQSLASRPTCPRSGRLQGIPASWARKAATAPSIFWSCYHPPALKPLIACAKSAVLGKHVYFSSSLLMHQLSPAFSGKGTGRPSGGKGSACRRWAAGRKSESCLPVPGAVANPCPGAPAPPWSGGCSMSSHSSAGVSGGDSSRALGVSTGPAQPPGMGLRGPWPTARQRLPEEK